ncbi:PREDICTED: uncharacterized protein LOC105140504 isoform X3 [Populus euphratica]|uniref:Uncharacterized protein LOC105140504 isoform X3 n=1 Tax=Populus euphratica TaxID=75702 RepID=A0AAJ6Y876_POPEU|nr:PREDICTED: uncharacterized protein LOC105140504 isoform X3 [Populus euphratica]
MTEEDEWVHVALNDDTLVVELLLKLNEPEQLPPPAVRRRRRRRFAADLAKEGAVLALSVDWSVRQRRSSSKQVMMTRSKKGSDSLSTRASPTTPLSFSGGTSVSGGGAGDGFDEATTSACLPAKLIATSRSKVAVTSGTPTIKRSRKKKFDLLSQHRPEIFTASVKSEDVISIKPQETKVACDSTYSVLAHNVSFQLQEDEGRKPSFTLPDLNLPVDGDSGSGILG